jgi:hydrogenase maturation factor
VSYQIFRTCLHERPVSPGYPFFDTSRMVSLYTLARVYQLAAKPAASLSDLCALSLVMYKAELSVLNPLLRARACAVWDQAETRCGSLLRKPGKHVSIHERLVLETMDTDEAASLLFEGEWTMLGSSSSLGQSKTVSNPVLLLKKTLGNCVFEQGCFESLEDARDVAVDLIVESELMIYICIHLGYVYVLIK